MRSQRLATVFAVLTVACLSTATAQPLTAIPGTPSKLSKIRIRPGTALDKLSKEGVAASKEMRFMNLPRAKRMRLDIPDWLRAHYDRNHPQALAAVSTDDPTGGLPLALEDLYVWMLHNQDLKPTTALPPSPPTKVLSVGTNRLISGQQTTPRSESGIRTNPASPKQIIAASNSIGPSQQSQFFSPDGGTSWGQTTLPLQPGDHLNSDPTVDWTSDGTAWATTIGIVSNTVLQMRAYKSADAGKTWTFDATFSGEQTSTDKQMMWVDHNATSKSRDNIYVIWHNNAPAFIARRTASGWQPPIQVSGAETTGTAIGSDITANSNGDVFGVWPDTVSQNLFVIKSVDGGASFSKPESIAKTFGSFDIGVPAFSERRALIQVSIAAFRDGTRDDVYVSWVDLSGEPGCKSPDNEPADDVKSPCKSRIWFARSTTGGKTWDAPQKINDGASLNDQFNHRLAVDPASGTLGIVYYDTAASKNRKRTNLMFQASVDGGGHWSSPATTVSSATTDETTATADSGNQYGDYNGLSVADGVFHPSWTDRRNKASEQVYTAAITVTKDSTGSAVPSLVEETASEAAPAATRGKKKKHGA